MWLPKNDPLTGQGLPTYEEQLLAADGQPIRLAAGAAREYILGFTIPNGSVAEIGLVTDWQRAVNGNMTGKGSAVYTFDAFDRLTQVVSATMAVQFAYDGDGVRLRKTVNSRSVGLMSLPAATHMPSRSCQIPL